MIRVLRQQVIGHGLRRGSRLLLTLSMVLQVAVGQQAVAYALTPADNAAVTNDWVNWVADNGGCTVSSGGQVTTASGLPADIAANINNLKPVYQKVEAATKVPWQLIAAVHYREANNDPTKDLQSGNPIGGPYPAYASYPYGKPTTIDDSALFAAKQLIAEASNGVVKKSILMPNPDMETIKDALFGYNGRAAAYATQAATLGFSATSQPYEGSPYVMNNYDKVHTNMKIITVDFGAPDAVDTRLGAFTVYAKLGGTTTSNGGGACSGTTGGSSSAIIGDAVKTAIGYAWPDYHAAPYITMEPSYSSAVLVAKANGEYIGGNSYPGIDCGGYITRVMRNSKVDPTYNAYEGPTTAQQKYMNDHPEKYQRLGPQTSTSGLNPGDIAINSEHTYMYVGKQPGFNGNSASASLDERAPMAGNAYFSNSAGYFIWYRPK